MARALAGESVDETEIYIRNPERPLGVHIVVQASPFWDENNELAGGIVLIRDISRKKEIEARIGTLTNAVEQTADTIVITNKGGRIEYVNPAFEQTTGYTRAEALGRTPAILKSGVHNDAFYKNLWETVTSGKVFRATIANRKKSGEIYFAEQTITPMRDSAGGISHYVSVVKDVTEQRKLQEQEAQMKVARAVQQRFYRVAPPQAEGFDIAGAAFPADATGGDYFDFFPLQQGFIGIAVGDICGHGIGSALLMVELRSCLRAFAMKSSDLAEIFTLLNGALVSDLQQDRFATLTFCRLHPPSRSIVYANAGHFPGYILDAGGAVKRTLDSMDIPLGMFSKRTFTCSEEIQLEPGDILVLLTDGILEAERPDEMRLWGRARARFHPGPPPRGGATDHHGPLSRGTEFLRRASSSRRYYSRHLQMPPDRLTRDIRTASGAGPHALGTTKTSKASKKTALLLRTGCPHGLRLCIIRAVNKSAQREEDRSQESECITIDPMVEQTLQAKSKAHFTPPYADRLEGLSSDSWLPAPDTSTPLAISSQLLRIFVVRFLWLRLCCAVVFAISVLRADTRQKILAFFRGAR